LESSQVPYIWRAALVWWAAMIGQAPGGGQAYLAVGKHQLGISSTSLLPASWTKT